MESEQAFVYSSIFQILQRECRLLNGGGKIKCNELNAGMHGCCRSTSNVCKAREESSVSMQVKRLAITSDLLLHVVAPDYLQCYNISTKYSFG